ncbi:MAG: flagellar biosynthetic protein FliR [Burkholderiales bacterium]
MLSISTTQLDTWIAAFLFPMARVLALVATAPILGNRGIPARIRLGVGLVLTFAIAPLAGPPPEVAPASWSGLVILVEQIAIGVTMGFTMRLAFAAVDMAGELIGLQMGLGFANFFDPQHGVSVPVVAQFMGLLATLFFLAINGHLMVIATLAESFSAIPIGTGVQGGEQVAMGAAAWGGQIFLSGLTLALPVLAALLITNVALGVLTRTAPQLNIFAVGFPITLLFGFFMLALTLPYLSGPLEKLLGSGVGAALELVSRMPRS